jgi:hypothetical protein
MIENLIKSNLKTTRKLWHALGNWNLEGSWRGLHGGDFIIFRPKRL